MFPYLADDTMCVLKHINPKSHAYLQEEEKDLMILIVCVLVCLISDSSAQSYWKVAQADKRFAGVCFSNYVNSGGNPVSCSIVSIKAEKLIAFDQSAKLKSQTYNLSFMLFF